MTIDAESLSCPSCSHRVASRRTVGLQGDKIVTCPKCNLKHALQQWRKDQDALEVSDAATAASNTPPPIPTTDPIGDAATRSPSEPTPTTHSQSAPADRIPCPSCAEQILPAATVCPFCKHAVLSKDKNTNAVVGLLLSVVIFFGLYYMISAFTRYEGKKEYNRIMKDSEQETERLMRDAERQAKEMMDRLGQ